MYSWLNKIYKSIIYSYQNKKNNALLLHTSLSNGEEFLCHAISSWLICCMPNGIKNCGICENCKLIINNNNKNYYYFKLKNKNDIIQQNNIQILMENIYQKTNYDYVNVICIHKIELLRRDLINMLLKIIENPPHNIYVILICNKISPLFSLIKSFCFYWFLPSPNIKLSIQWLSNTNNFDLISSKIALLQSGGSPILAKKILYVKNWQKRKKLYKTLFTAINNNNMLLLLPILKENDDLINYILTLIVDAIKYQQNLNDYLINIDQISLIDMVANKWDSKILFLQWKKWIFYIYQIKQNINVNRKFILIHYLINWENINKNFFS